METIISVEDMKKVISKGYKCDNAQQTYCLLNDGTYQLVNRPYLTFKTPFRYEYCVPAYTIEELVENLPQF